MCEIIFFRDFGLQGPELSLLLSIFLCFYALKFLFFGFLFFFWVVADFVKQCNGWGDGK